MSEENCPKCLTPNKPNVSWGTTMWEKNEETVICRECGFGAVTHHFNSDGDPIDSSGCAYDDSRCPDCNGTGCKQIECGGSIIDFQECSTCMGLGIKDGEIQVLLR